MNEPDAGELPATHVPGPPLKRGERRRVHHRAAVAGGAVLFALAAAGMVLLAAVNTIGEIEASLGPLAPAASVPTSTIVLDRDGKLLRAFTIAEGRWRLPVTKGDVDPRFLDMLIAYEDRRFARARRHRHSRAGPRGGPIPACRRPHRLRRLDAHHAGRTPHRRLAERAASDGKLRQIAIARALERQFSKDEILNLYLTLAPYGGNIEGIRAATLAYFGKEPRV